MDARSTDAPTPDGVPIAFAGEATKPMFLAICGFSAWVPRGYTGAGGTNAGRRNRQDQALGAAAGAAGDPGRAAARREHWRCGARHGEFWSRPAAAGQAAGALAQPAGAQD